MSFGEKIAKQNMKTAILHHMAQYVLLIETKFDDDESLIEIALALRNLIPSEIIPKVEPLPDNLLDFTKEKDKRDYWKQQVLINETLGDN